MGLKLVTCMHWGASNTYCYYFALLLFSGKVVDYDQTCQITKDSFCMRAGKSKYGCKYNYKPEGTECREGHGPCDKTDYCKCLQLLPRGWQKQHQGPHPLDGCRDSASSRRLGMLSSSQISATGLWCTALMLAACRPLQALCHLESFHILLLCGQ